MEKDSYCVNEIRIRVLVADLHRERNFISVFIFL